MNEKFRNRIKRNDRLARWVITLGGMAVIFSVVFILLLIVRVTFPLFQQPRAEVYAKFPLSGGGTALAVGVDDYLETAFALAADGAFSFIRTADGELLDRVAVAAPPGATVAAVEAFDGLTYGLLWSDGSLTLCRVVFRPHFDEAGRRSIVPGVEALAAFASGGGERPLRSLARLADDGRRTRVDLLPDNRLFLTQSAVSTDFFGNEQEERHAAALTAPLPGAVTALTLDREGGALYAGTDNGHLLRWDLGEVGSPRLLEQVRAFADGRTVTALALVFGDVSLAVGDARGGLSTWFPVRDGEKEGKRLKRIHTLASHAAPVTAILPSRRDKSLLSLDADGLLHLDHMTSERHLLALESHAPLLLTGFSTRGDGILGVNADGRAVLWQAHVPHPEVSWQTLFGKVWYEGYDAPALVWQSSAANDDFEPKLSLTPLIFGTLKGTFYAMVFAVPLALFAAIYTSQFAKGRTRALIKPTVEVMAAIPSVVIGFLAALWLAPLVERSLGALFLSLVFLPTALLAAILLWQGARRLEPLKRVEKGFEFLAVAPVLVLAVAAAFVLGPLVEAWLFGGDLKLWLFQETGTRYDPRNCIIIAFALGFAVIPIIFTIAEDALSNVPPSLTAASLAVGASRWQTVWRVILPSASPGIFAGAMIGFGRAVGETMIVLMATGNTPIMDPSIFNGMRPLSANIAVEIPEAPLGGTLYRVLFLSAVILFLMTFAVNTVAELVRQRLRKKYGRF